MAFIKRPFIQLLTQKVEYSWSATLNHYGHDIFRIIPFNNWALF